MSTKLAALAGTASTHVRYVLYLVLRSQLINSLYYAAQHRSPMAFINIRFGNYFNIFSTP